MTTNQYEAGLEPELERRPRLRQALDAFRGRSPMTDLELEAALPTADWRTEKGRPFGVPGMEVRTLRKRLAETGLIQPAGKGANGAKLWRPTPAGQAEVAARKYRNALKRSKKSNRGESPAAKLAQMRKMIPGEWSQFHKTRRTILTLGPALKTVEPMAFWETAPADELEWVRQEIADLTEWGQRALDAIAQRQADDVVRRKIEKLTENTNGRTPAEAEAMRLKAEELRTKL